ncbi:MarR family transcriptional regulator [Bacillus obstructivus]|uniref:MarR family transcriptional regulator n=1 Tax=Heyndrickxia oleronia TaxID=38875 RepID=A0AAW6T2Y6_9BACI|nr:MarR family transcriptional regulator [Heyndrickxia oleronia]MDH5164145.1 MarR family transcriptional regulator [Heyndrickxia oleronia]OJH20115.1 MarR family transcriptional regulator [Bacillus obstructivus]
MDKNKTIFELIHEMDQVTNQLIIQWNQMFSESLGISHILVINHLNKHGKSRPSDIARSLGLTPPSLTHLSEKLIKKGFANRMRDENDRRILYLDITDEGRKVLSKAQESGKTLRKQLVQKLTDEEISQLLNLYEKLNK